MTDIYELLAEINHKLDAMFVSQPKQDKPMSGQDAARYLGMSYNTFTLRVASGQIAYTVPNKARRYHKSDLDAYLRNCKVMSHDEIGRRNDQARFR